MRRAARYLAISSKKSLCALKKKERRGAKSSTSSPRRKRPFNVFDAVAQGEGQLLDGGRAGLADVIAADGNGIELRRVLRAEFNGVGHQAHAMARAGRYIPSARCIP